MRRLLAFFWLFFTCVAVHGEIFETQHFKEIHSYLVPGTIVVLDIDDTLLIPVQMLGCDVWFQHRLQDHQKAGCSFSESLDKSLAEWEAVRHLTKMQLVEPGNAEEVSNLQKQGYTVMCLTTQAMTLERRTKQHLLDHQIDVTFSGPTCKDEYFTIDGEGVLFRNGILYTAGAHKGKALFALFERLCYMPQHILFINDKHAHLLSIEEIAKQKGVPFVGLRYAYSDSRKAAFDKKIADYQFKHSTFSHILSDEEARKICDMVD